MWDKVVPGSGSQWEVSDDRLGNCEQVNWLECSQCSFVYWLHVDHMDDSEQVDLVYRPHANKAIDFTNHIIFLTGHLYWQYTDRLYELHTDHIPLPLPTTERLYWPHTNCLYWPHTNCLYWPHTNQIDFTIIDHIQLVHNNQPAASHILTTKPKLN